VIKASELQEQLDDLERGLLGQIDHALGRFRGMFPVRQLAPDARRGMDLMRGRLRRAKLAIRRAFRDVAGRLLAGPAELPDQATWEYLREVVRRTHRLQASELTEGLDGLKDAGGPLPAELTEAEAARKTQEIVNRVWRREQGTDGPDVGGPPPTPTEEEQP
jgi:hypothetical protein